MDIWVKTQQGHLANIKNCLSISDFCLDDNQAEICLMFEYKKLVIGKYNHSRIESVMLGIENHINAIGTNNFNNKEMVYVMPL